MAEELQQLLEKIQHDGVEKANAESTAILARAKADADAILKEAAGKADALRIQAEADARAFVERARKTVQQAARDTILDVKEALTKCLDDLLTKDVQAALADPQHVASLALQAIQSLGTAGVEVAAASDLARALQAQLAAAAVHGVKVVVDETTGAGFSIRLDGGRVEHDFSEATLAAALARRLRPELAALVK